MRFASARRDLRRCLIGTTTRALVLRVVLATAPISR